MLFALFLAAAAAQAPAAPPKIVSVVRSDATHSAVSLLPPSANNPTHPAMAIAPGSWFTPDSYPPEAARKGIEGSVRFEVSVDATGKATACRIVKSSNYDLLDQATCKMVLANARFIPAAVNGKPVAGTFQTSTVWRLSGGTIGPTNGYVAAIMDFSKDPDHPSCSIITKGILGGPTCEEALRRFRAGAVQEKLKQVVALMTITSGNDRPYQGEVAWGRRISFVAINLYTPKDPKTGSKPLCEIVADDGGDPGMNPCAPYGGPVSDAHKNDPKAHIERSIFAIEEASPSSPGKCKSGESSAEVHGCV